MYFVFVLSLFSFHSRANVYDVSKLETLNEICHGGSFTVRNGIYSCSGQINLALNAKIINPVSTKPVTLVSFGHLTLQGNNTIGSETNRINIKTAGSDLEININNTDSVTRIYGDIESHADLSLQNAAIWGNLRSSGGNITVTGSKNFILGDIHAFRKLHLDSAQVDGDIYAGSSSFDAADASILTNNSIINGQLDSVGNIRVKQSDVCGDITSSGQHVFIEGSQNHIVGALKAFGNANIMGARSYGIADNTSNISAHKVTIDKTSQVFSSHLAVKSFLRPSIESVLICGKINASEPGINGAQNYCGFKEPQCQYSNQIPPQCPLISEDLPSCIIAPPLEDNFELVVTPSEQLALMCGQTLPKFSAQTMNLGQVTSTQVNTSLSHPKLFSLQMVVGDSKLSPNAYLSTSDGRLELRIRPKNIDQIKLDERYSVTFTLNADTNKTQTVEFMFTPYLFEAYSLSSGHKINSIESIAGKPQNVNTRLLACTIDNKAVIATNYQGNANVSHTLLKPMNGTDGQFRYETNFKQGISSTNFITKESGLFEVKVSDAFKCNGFSSCPESGHVEVEGYFQVKSRPWTLAICPDSHPLQSGTSAAGAGFIAAGEQFSLSIKPIIWQKEGYMTQDVNTASLCDAPVTHNFMLADAPSTNIVLTSKQSTPTETASQTQVLLESTDTLRKTQTQHEDNAYRFKQLFWDEVGSLRVNVSLDSEYLGMRVNQGYRDIGRFYPKYFNATSSQWLYPNQQDFIYMNQPLDGIYYDVIALNSKQQNTSNYAYFHPNLQALFYLGELSDYTTRFIPPAPIHAEWINREGSSVGSFVIEKPAFSPNCENSPCFRKDHPNGNYPDGPFNSGLDSQKSKIGLVSLNNVDEILFWNDQHIFKKQPDIRFGRLNFSDVSGYQGTTIPVPLRVETWQKGQFVLNTDDNTTQVNAKEFIITPLWPNSPDDNAMLSGEGVMLAGITHQLLAKQKKPIREQVMFHLNLNHSSQALPWLKYNWDTSTPEEDDPSAIVTFGIHRGNDRIIYRGEPGVVGTH